ncbi:MAG: glycosyltransferase family 4 protein, partial [Patescibacteria group bacterium]
FHNLCQAMGKTTKKALIYSPYLDFLGGGERYCLTVAESLLAFGWQVDILWPKDKQVREIAKKLNLSIDRAGFVSQKRSRGYDLTFWLSDGSIPFLFAKRNLLHIQRPFIGVGGRSFLNQIKLKKIDSVIVNSRFTKRFTDVEYGVDSVILYPPVDLDQFKPGKKENIILAVGRFEESFKAKAQDVLLDAFCQMVDAGLSGWRLVLIGGSLSEPSQNQFLGQLKKQASDYPVEFLVNASFSDLKDYYARAKIFWHGAGYWADEKKEPWAVEHFGMTPVEAMSAGCVPVVIDKGGLKEIVRRGVGERWQTVSELKEKTLKLINDSDLWRSYQKESLAVCQKFSKKVFSDNLKELID